MLRIHLTAEDLARVTIAAEPDPLWEVLLSLHMVQGEEGRSSAARGGAAPSSVSTDPTCAC